MLREVLFPACTSMTVKHSPSVMCWGGFSWHGVGPLIALEGSVNGAVHVETLRAHAVPAITALFREGNRLLQEENAALHKAKVVQNFKQQAGVATQP